MDAPDTRLDRRRFLWTAFRGGLAAAVLPALPLPRALAGDGPRRGRTGKRVLVPIFLRGGADGLNVVVPHGEPEYYRLRPQLAVPRPGSGGGSAIDLDGAFGLHPALGPLVPLWREGRLAVLHAVGHEAASRSHFTEQDVWETASVADRVAASGWCNRFLAEHEGDGPVRAVAFGGALPRILRGEVPVPAIGRLEELRLAAGGDRRARSLRALARAHEGDGLLAETGRETLEAIDALSGIDPAAYAPENGAVYPESPLGTQLRQAAQLLRADVGLEVVEVELGGFDTHQAQGGATGAQAGLLADLAASVAAFLVDLGPRADDVLCVTLSEFGRTAAQNGTLGTDHGHASCLLAAGGLALAPGLHGRFPGLAPGDLNEGRDLAHTTDFRDAIADVLTHHMGCRDLAQVLPGRHPKPTGLFRRAW